MKRLLSYIYPITKSIESQYNGTLEITWYNGKKHLNSKNANYSYGSLQRILKFGLEQIELSKYKSVLLLGLGGGSVIETLINDFNYQNSITAVEIDPIIIKIAKDEFNITESNQINIFCQDAFDFILNNSNSFDLIIIDLFIDLDVPHNFLKLDFWDSLLATIPSHGCLLFNASVKDTKNNTMDTLIDYLKTKIYKVDVFEKVNNTNTLIIAKGL